MRRTGFRSRVEFRTFSETDGEAAKVLKQPIREPIDFTVSNVEITLIDCLKISLNFKAQTLS